MKSYALIAVAMIVAPLAALADHSSAPAASEETCAISTNLTIGSRGEAVMCLQTHLIENGLLGISAVTGYYGEMTKSAVVQWQQAHGLPQTGFFGSLSRSVWSGASVPAAPAVDMHPAVDVSTWPSVPSVSIILHKDAMSGYNLEILPANFRFAPEHVNGAVAANEGHAHLYIDGKKISRVYGPWTHLPKELFSKGAHEVVITLNANDHSELALEGRRIEVKTAVTTE